MYQPSHPIPVSIVTGFLGAGKSTLLNRLLGDPALADAAVIINEFGAVGIDHLLVERSGDSVIELANGCLCCTVRGELIDTLADLLDRMQTGKIKPVNRVIIETTGLADPVPVLMAIMAHPAIAAAFSVDGVVTLVDAVTGIDAIERHDEAARQVAVADRLVITKTDLVSAKSAESFAARLSAINPTAEIVDGATPMAANPHLLVAGLFDPARKSAEVGEWLRAAETGHDHHHHDVNRHDEHIRAFALLADALPSRQVIEAFQHRLAREHGDHILRIKGIVAIAGEPRPLVIHGVGTTVYPSRYLAGWPEDSAPETRIVVIGADLGEKAVRDLFASFLDRPAVDRPDRAALEENPLAAFGFRR